MSQQKYVKENALEQFIAGFSELFWSHTWLKAGWLLCVCRPQKGMVWDCLSLYLGAGMCHGTGMSTSFASIF